MQGTGHASAGVLARIYTALAGTRQAPSRSATAVVLAGVSVTAAVAERLDRLAVDVYDIGRDPAVEPAAYLIGGALHGVVVPVAEDSADGPELIDTAPIDTALIDLVQQARLRDWAAEILPDPVFTTMHKPGSDSRGVVQFRVGAREVVAKIGARDAIEGEARFATRVNALLAEDGRPGLFPEVFGVRREGGWAVSLMEAGRPLPLAPLFADPARTTLADTAPAVLGPHLDHLAAWYRRTAAHRRPTVADYLYRERYHVLPRTPAFVDTFRSFFGDLPMAELFNATVLLPGGLVVPGYHEAVGWLDRVAPALLPDHGTAVHGDIYAANMLVRADGSPMLIDPRTVWENRDRPDVGYGDPVFDLATLLHGVLPMAAVLHAVENDVTSELFAAEVRPGGGTLDLSALRLPVAFPPTVRALTDRMLATLPHADPNARTRLYIGAATSLAGWLKYERSLRTPAAWLATYAYVAWYLWQARACRDSTHDVEVL